MTVEGVAAEAEVAAGEGHVVAVVLHVDEAADGAAAVEGLALAGR